MEGGIHVYCINLKHRMDRWKRFSEQPELQEIMKHYTFERFEGINGSMIDIANDSRISLRTKRNIKEHVRRDHEELDTAGGVGCYLSHTTVWKKFLERPEPYAIVLEDDAYLYEGFLNDFQTAMKDTTLLPQIPDIWYFQDTPFELYYESKSKQSPDTIKERNLGPWITQTCSTFTAYLISKNGAKKLLSTAFPLDMHVDLYTCLAGDLKHIFSVSHRNILIQPVPLKECDTDIQAKNICLICDIPTNYQKHGIIIVNVPIILMALGIVGSIYYLSHGRGKK